MEGSILKTAGQIAGIGGIALAVLLLVFRDVIRKNIFPTLTKDQAYKLIKLIVVLVFIIAVIGISAWVFTYNAGSPGPTVRSSPNSTPTEPPSSRKWRIVPIQSREHYKTVQWKKTWSDIAWLGSEGWLCGSIWEGGGGGPVGEGVLLHTSDGGASWTEIDKSRFSSGQGTFTWGPHGKRLYSWTEVGPIKTCSFYRRLAEGRQSPSEGWLASSTGIYFSNDGGESWKRMTPPPNDPDRYAFFLGFVSVEVFSELYAVGWQGIAHWSRTSQRWALQKATYAYGIVAISTTGGAENRSVWAVGRAGTDEQGNSGSKSHGAIYHLSWPENKWEQVELTGITFRTAQSFTDIIVPDYGTVFAAGGEGLLIRGSHVNGKWEWTKLEVPTEVNLNSLTYANDSLWVVGDVGVILESKDKGKTWARTLTMDEDGRPRNLQRIRFVDDTGWIVGDGLVLSTVPR